MSNKPGRPLFLERRGYRRRRLADAAFLLPLLGLLLFCAPVLWPRAEQAKDADPVLMSSAITYVFGAWFVLILLTAIFGGQVRREGMEPRADADQVGSDRAGGDDPRPWPAPASQPSDADRG